MQLAHLPPELLTLCASHLVVWERVYMSRACRAFRVAFPCVVFSCVEQVKNKHYALLQLVDQHTEWMALKRMKAKGYSVVYAPARFTQFVRSENRMKRRIQ
jgi:hypothetical protein